MSDRPLHVGVVFGGVSVEHEVSWVSARNVTHAMDRRLYLPIPILIDHQGNWSLVDNSALQAFSFEGGSVPETGPQGRRVILDPDGGRLHLRDRDTGAVEDILDVVFPLVHGTGGEDGTLQGLCQLFRIPFVGPGVMASAACMDKDVMKRVLREKGIPIPRFRVLVEGSRTNHDPAGIVHELGLPLFVKPANLGSSVGITKVKRKEDLDAAISHAFEFDAKLLVEEGISGREIECSVLGNREPQASVPGEVIPRHEFYSYKDKYYDPNGADLKIPAPLPPEVAEKIRQLAIQSFCALGCEGMARVDFFLRPDGEVLVNELNTIPGFTDISMYPKLWEASGVSCGELVHRLIGFAFERFRREAGKSHDRQGAITGA